jgi:alkanesulfonate monooxygenase SsuD/methylene tetrahydromethanopterin reductase-like flavin-dependent oxidoreductase (luciferase family)
VYQQFATMDQMSGGRVELLAGRGSFIESYPLFGLDLGDYDALFEEKIRLLLRLDSGEPVTWRGRFRPGLTDALVLPRPADLPGRGEHLTIAIATGGNPESSVRAATLGLPVSYAIIGGRPAAFGPLVELYRRVSAEKGHPAAKRFVTVAGMGFIADDGARALRFFAPYYLDSMRRIAAERGFPAPTRQSYEATAARGGAYFVGAPEDVAQRIVELHGLLHHDRQIFQMDLSGVPQKESMRAIELLGTEVKPMVGAALGPSAAG